ncbi:MAG: WbqC family protein [Lentisphaeraceae bacterium]|nr:WbqC family protein [Lentisphaeraceae bacterium]
MSKVAIHQPNFFPWLGYFSKIINADLFVILDHVQLTKKGGNWFNRVAISNQNESQWITVPISRSYHGFKSVKDISMTQNIIWRKKLIKKLSQEYNKTPFFDSLFPVIKSLIQYETDNLYQFNLNSLQKITSMLGIPQEKIIFSSAMNLQTNSTQMLIDIVKNVGGSTYMCGGGTSSYQDDQLFAKEGIELVYQNFNHPEYPQQNTREFLKGLSILDALFNLGCDETHKILINSPC